MSNMARWLTYYMRYNILVGMGGHDGEIWASDFFGVSYDTYYS